MSPKPYIKKEFDQFTIIRKKNNMKLALFFSLICTAGAVNRLQMFHKHHAQLHRIRNGNYTDLHSHTKSTSSNERELIRKEKVLGKICTFQTCAKCHKLVDMNTELASKYCSFVINMPDCCSSKRMLFGRLWASCWNFPLIYLITLKSLK